MANPDKKVLAQTTWEDNARRWKMRGLAAAMNEWLDSLVAGSKQYKGFELAGMLDPKDPNPKKFKPPPEWLGPDILMKSACVWYAGALQDALFTRGIVPLVRAGIDAEGTLLTLAGADVEAAAWRTGTAGAHVYYFVVNQEGTSYPLTEHCSIAVQVRGDEPAAISVKRVAWNSANTIPGADRPTGLFESYSGWSYRVADGGTAWTYLHVFA